MPAIQPSYHAVDVANQDNDARATSNQPSDGRASSARNAAAAMSLSKLVKDVERGLGESQNQRDARVESLWAKLDPGRTGELDLKGLRKGFRKIDHRKQPLPEQLSAGSERAADQDDTALKNADELLRQIMDEVDTNHDGKIQYEGTFRSWWSCKNPFAWSKLEHHH